MRKDKPSGLASDENPGGAKTRQLQTAAIDNLTLECMELQSRVFVSNQLTSGLAEYSLLVGTPTGPEPTASGRVWET